MDFLGSKEESDFKFSEPHLFPLKKLLLVEKEALRIGWRDRVKILMEGRKGEVILTEGQDDLIEVV